MKYFDYNLPERVPAFLHPDLHYAYSRLLEKVRNRMDKLEDALAMSGMDAAAFAKIAQSLFGNFPERFDSMGAEEICNLAVPLYDGAAVPHRLEWPNAEVVVDTAFLRKEEWEMLRRIGIGGSESAIVSGVSPYRTQRELYHDKVGTPVVGPPEKSSEAVFARGHFMENGVVDAFCSLTGAKRVPETRMFRSKTHPHCTANMDAVIEINGHLYVFEAKTTVRENMAAWTNGKIPRHYITQMRHYAAVLNDPRIMGTYIGCIFTEDYTVGGAFVGASSGGRDFLPRLIERDEEAERELLDETEAFWNDYVETGVLPPESGIPSKDAEVFRRYSGYADPSAPVVVKKFSEYGDDIGEYLRLEDERRVLEKKAKQIKDRQDQIANRFIEALGTAVEGILSVDAETYIEVRYAPRQKTVVDKELLEAKYREAYNECVEVIPEGSRVFSLKEKKKKGAKWEELKARIEQSDKDSRGKSS